MRYRLLVAVIALLVFLITYAVGQHKIQNITAQTEELNKQYQKVQRLIAEYRSLAQQSKTNKAGMLKGGVLTFVQNISTELGVSEKINSIKPVPGTKEVVEVVYNNMTLRNIVDLFAKVRDYRNLRVKSFAITRRYDAPEFADLRVQIEKIK